MLKLFFPSDNSDDTLSPPHRILFILPAQSVIRAVRSLIRLNQRFTLLQRPFQPRAAQIVDDKQGAGQDPGNRIAAQRIKYSSARIEQNPHNPEQTDS